VETAIPLKPDVLAKAIEYHGGAINPRLEPL